MPTLVHYNDAGHKAALRDATQIASRFTELLTHYQTLNLPASVATDDLPALLADPTAWLVGKYTGGQPFQYGGLTLDPAKVLEMLVRPAGFDVFIMEANALAEDLGMRPRIDPPRRRHGGVVSSIDEYAQGIEVRPYVDWARPVRSASSYAVVGGWQVQFTGKAAAALENSFKQFATTPAQEALLADVTALCALLNKMQKRGIDLDTIQKTALLTNPYDRAVPAQINPAFIFQNAR
jgi:hypothetical protein